MASSSSKPDATGVGHTISPTQVPLREFSVGSSSTQPAVEEVGGNAIISTDDTQTCNPFAKKERKKTSSVWNDFTLIKLADGTEKVQCNHCKHKLMKSKGGATTQYKRHLLHCGRRIISSEGQLNLSIQTPSISGGRVIDQYRASLGTETVQYLMCGSDWYRNFYGIKRKIKVKEEMKEINLP